MPIACSARSERFHDETLLGRLNWIIWALLSVLGVLLALAFVFDFGPFSWVLVALMVVVLALDFVSRQRSGR